MRQRSLLVAVLVAALSGGVDAAAPPPPTTSSRLEWFNQAKFGLFIHWGLYAVPAGEWGAGKDYGEWIMLQADIPVRRYEAFAKEFNPTAFDAREWVALARDAGMKYLVVTAKHHDGFSLYDSKLTDYDIVDASPFGRDPLKELAEESRKAGLVFSTYYSVVDWHHPEFPARYSQIRKPFPDGYHGAPREEADVEKYAAYMKGQVKELLTNYGDIGILWFDGGGSFRNRDREALLDGKELVDMIHELQPKTLINNRLGFGADYGTPEQHIPAGPTGTAFEVCMTLNRHWGYNKNDHDWKSADTVIHNLVDIASKGGNYLLNVGPDATGRIPEASQRILREVGAWLATNGEAIYGTTAGPASDNVRAGGSRMTQKPGRLYVTVLDWPKDGKVFLEGMKGRLVKKAWLLADTARKPLRFDARERSLTIDVPAAAPDPRATVIAIEVSDEEPIEG